MDRADLGFLVEVEAAVESMAGSIFEFGLTTSPDPDEWSVDEFSGEFLGIEEAEGRVGERGESSEVSFLIFWLLGVAEGDAEERLLESSARKILLVIKWSEGAKKTGREEVTLAFISAFFRVGLRNR